MTSNRLFSTMLQTLLLISLLLQATVGYPDHLTAGRMGCMTELSSDEVIMNNSVVPFEESEHKEIKVGWKLQEKDGGLRFDSIVIDKVPFEAILFLSVPKESGLKDVHYVIETTVQPGVRFEYGGCDDKRRVPGRVFDDRGHKLFIEEMPEKPIEVWGGWAAGYEAVKLTDRLILKPGSAEEKKPAEPAVQKTDKKTEHHVEEGKVDRDVEDMVEEVIELEEAEETEREALEDELGDDDGEAGIGDAEARLPKELSPEAAQDVANAVEEMMRRKREAVAEMQTMKNKDIQDSMDQMRELRDRLKEKPRLHNAGEHDVTDEQLAKVKERLKEMKLSDAFDHSKKRLYERHREHHRHHKVADHPSDLAPGMTEEQKREFAKKMEAAKAERRERFLTAQHRQHQRAKERRQIIKQDFQSGKEKKTKAPMSEGDLSKFRDLDFQSFRKFAMAHKDQVSDRVLDKLNEIDQKQKKEEEERLATEEAKKNEEYDDDEYADDKAEEPVYKTKQTFLRRISKKYHAVADVDIVHHMFGAVFFIIAMLFVVQLCMWTGSPPKKGTLDL